jgi:hypothetical protein
VLSLCRLPRVLKKAPASFPGLQVECSNLRDHSLDGRTLPPKHKSIKWMSKKCRPLFKKMQVKQYFSSERYVLYRVLKSMTLGRFPNGGESDSTRRTEEVRHVGSDTITPGF